jgi:uncharacterized protein
MIIQAKVTPRSRKIEVREERGILIVKVNAPALDGKANEALLEAVADFYKIKKRNVAIIAGLQSKNKVLKIEK